MTITNEVYYQGTEGIYIVTVSGDQIRTTVTSSPSLVSDWIDDIQRIHRRRLNRLIAGLDVEWHPNFTRRKRTSTNPVATLQLCVGRICLIYQLIYTGSIPDSLAGFLSNPRYTFAGVGIEDDAQKLFEDYGLRVAETVDLADLATAKMGCYRDAGLAELARVVMGVDVEKPVAVRTSDWSAEWLSYEQIEYACVDAFLSFEIGRILEASRTYS